MADDGRGIYITEPTRPAGKGSESSTARSRYGKEIRVRDRRHSTPVRVQYAHSKPHQEKWKIDRAITQIGRKIIVDADMALELAGHKSGGRR